MLSPANDQYFLFEEFLIFILIIEIVALSELNNFFAVASLFIDHHHKINPGFFA